MPMSGGMLLWSGYSTECGDNDAGDRFKGVCDKDGCDFNSYRLGNTTFFGAGSSFSMSLTSCSAPLAVKPCHVPQRSPSPGGVYRSSTYCCDSRAALRLPSTDSLGDCACPSVCVCG